jgi:molybdate transport system substrate-binding protein
MMFKKFNILISVLVLTLLFGCSSPDVAKEEQKIENTETKGKIELTISAAASLQDALTEIESKYEEKNTNIDLSFNFGSSGALKQQIEQGAPVDLFFSAAEDKFDELVDAGEIDTKKGVDLVGNELVLIMPSDSQKKIEGFSDLVIGADKLSLGTPESVPAGEYGKQTLENLNLWDSLSSKIVYAKDVRQVLSYVETGNVDAGIVYKTDALISDKVRIVAAADEKTHDPIIYPVGVIKDTKYPEEATKFFEYLQGKESIEVLEKYGFVTKK